MSYGVEGYGTDPYGSEAAIAAGILTIARAKPVSTHVVRVTFTKDPQALSAQLAGDVLNPRTWQITRLDTGVGFTVVAITSTIASEEWDVRVLEAFGSSNITHQIVAATLLDHEGDPIEDPSYALFAGALDASLSTPERRAANQKFAIRDLTNPQTVLPSGGAGGVYTITKQGDYELHGGTDFVRKLIFRRLMTTKGAFRFLPGFGVGLRVKEPVPTGDLFSLQKEIEDQVRLEPEVDRVSVSVSQDQNHLKVTVLARLKTTGQQISVPLSVPFGVNL